MSDHVIVIGAGVSGLTTALSLQLLDYETKIITATHPKEVTNKNDYPEFASLYPSASVIPHSVYSDQLEPLFKASQSFFYKLHKHTFSGLTIHKHFEIFEEEPGDPAYRHWMPNLQPLAELDSKTIPRRSDGNNLYGWFFDCIFADWALYYPALITMYLKSGGTITTRQLTSSSISELPADILVNCSGTGSPALFDDPSNQQLIMRGHLLKKAGADIITNNHNEIISYNYTPNASVYSDQQGEACDVYCYPRKDGWILGGSRQLGQLQAQNDGLTEESSASYSIDNISFPCQIIDLNNEILSHTYGRSLQLSDDITPYVGYRYIRNRKNGLRLEKEEIGNKIIYHNYGHGGAGVTLSWGCAFDITQKITGMEMLEIQDRLLQHFK